jgi:hypothetical protein
MMDVYAHVCVCVCVRVSVCVCVCVCVYDYSEWVERQRCTIIDTFVRVFVCRLRVSMCL